MPHNPANRHLHTLPAENPSLSQNKGPHFSSQLNIEQCASPHLRDTASVYGKTELLDEAISGLVFLAKQSSIPTTKA